MVEVLQVVEAEVEVVATVAVVVMVVLVVGVVDGVPASSLISYEYAVVSRAIMPDLQ